MAEIELEACMESRPAVLDMSALLLCGKRPIFPPKISCAYTSIDGGYTGQTLVKCFSSNWELLTSIWKYKAATDLMLKWYQGSVQLGKSWMNLTEQKTRSADKEKFLSFTLQENVSKRISLFGEDQMFRLQFCAHKRSKHCCYI